jgi:hypothetical protein
MKRQLRAIGTLGATVAIATLLASTAFAAPYIGRPIHAPYPVAPPVTAGVSDTTSSNTSTTTSTSSATTAKAPPMHAVPKVPVSDTTSGSIGGSGTTMPKQPLKTAQLKLCQDRAQLITTIMTSADTRAQNQITLFGNIATRVEAFYTSKGKTVPNYAQLVAVVNTAEAKANTDLTTLKANSTFSCNGDNPTGTVSAYRTDLGTEQTDLQNLRAAVKSLIIGVAKAEDFTLSSTATQGGQQ